MSDRPTIHRDGTFKFGGHWYRLLNNGPGWGYEILDSRMRSVADGFFTLREVRDHVERAEREGWDTLSPT